MSASGAPAPLSAECFEALLVRLRADGQPAERVYERLRARLVAVLRLHVAGEAESLADVALDRIARRIHEGTHIDNVHLYALGVARLLVLEARTKAARDRRVEAEIAHHGLSAEAPTPPGDLLDPGDAEDERMLAAVSECLDRLGKAASELLLAYYGGDGAERIAGRQRLAAELGISLNALRNRALRIRAMLERCAHERLEAGAARPDPSDESADGTT